MFDQAKSDDTEERHNERGDERERHLSPEAAGQLTILEIGISVKGDQGNGAGAKPGSEMVIGGSHSYVTLPWK